MQETRVQSLGRENPLEKGMAIHSSILVWKIPWTEELRGLQSMGSKRVRHAWATKSMVIWVKTNHLGKWGVSCSPGPTKNMEKQSLVSCLQCRRSGFYPWVEKILWRRKWQPISVFLPGDSHGQRRLTGYIVHGVTRVGHNLATKPPPPGSNIFLFENTDSNPAILLTFKN